MAFRLATATVTSNLSGQRGRAIVTAKGHHFVVDSPLTLGGPNEEINPIDLLLSSLATHGTFMCERIAREMGLPLKSVSFMVTGSFDPRGVSGEPVDPRIQGIRVRLYLEGVSSEQATILASAYQSRCTVYTTLARATTIDVDVVAVSSAVGEGES
jgi:uncharacterized OsmC-like protein